MMKNSAQVFLRRVWGWWLLFATTVAIIGVNGDDRLDVKVLQTRLPKPLSDLTASKSSTSGYVYLAGGCDSPTGNVFDTTGQEFKCDSISKSFYRFDPQSEDMMVLTDMPRSRYRHAAAVVGDDYVWIVGGRDADGNRTFEIDIYDVKNSTWFSPGNLSDAMTFSDHGGFSHGNNVYIVGGYDDEYVAQSQVLKLGLDNERNLMVEEVSNLLEARGDTIATADDNGAYVGGGFTHNNDFCEPLSTVESYDFVTDQWTLLPPLKAARADKALVAMNGFLFALGGERQLENHCEIGFNATPGERTIAVDDVEILDRSSPDNGWVMMESLPDFRFRFAAVGYDDTNRIYTFGGQVGYEEGCDCFRTTDEIVLYTDDPTVPLSTSAAATVGSRRRRRALLGTTSSWATTAKMTTMYVGIATMMMTTFSSIF